MKKQIIGGIIIAIVTIIVTGIIAKSKIFDDKIELKYSLSEKITTDFNDNIEESSVQQLTLKNSGDILINSIVVKINDNISEHKIIKFKSTDSVFTSKSKNHLEILYSELPPIGEILILLKSDGRGINKSNVVVSHSKGIAKEAFSKNESDESVFSMILSFVSLIVYFILIFIYSKMILIENMKREVHYSPIGLLRRKKPWYVKDDKWIEIRRDAISGYIKKDDIISVEKSDSYRILNDEKKDFLSNEEWNDLIKEAENKIQIVISEKIYKSFYGYGFEELTNLKRPVNISFEKWNTISQEISKAFCTHKTRNIFLYGSLSNVSQALKDSKPEIINNDDWVKLKEIITTLYVSKIIQDGISRINFEDYIEKFDLDVLDETEKSKILNYFKNLKDIYQSKEYLRLMLKTLKDMFYWKNIPIKPELLNNDDWEKIIEIYNRAIQSEQNAMKKMKDANELIDECIPLKEKIINQLNITDNLLRDPNSIDKVEEYNIPFEKGNWENLKKIAVLLNKK